MISKHFAIVLKTQRDCIHKDNNSEITYLAQSSNFRFNHIVIIACIYLYIKLYIVSIYILKSEYFNIVFDRF